MATVTNQSKTGIRYMPLEPQNSKQNKLNKPVLLGLATGMGILTLWKALQYLRR